jgi:hypothetical protein
MKNRDRYILKVNEYDMLMNMQKNIQNCYSCCALDVITGKMINCPEEMKGKVGEQSRLEVCGKCIQKWLNEED